MSSNDVRPTRTQDRPNISTEHQPEGDARRPRDTLDRKPRRDPASGGTIPSNYNPDTMTRAGEEEDAPRPERAPPGSDKA